MTAYLITIGDEILIGQIIDTNAAWMAQQLNSQGIRLVGKATVGDVHQHIVAAIGAAWEKADLVLMTGGLGATKDDITKKAIAEYFDVPMIWHQETFDRLTYFFKKIGREPDKMNREGCYMPQNALVLNNDRGLAPAMWFEMGKKILVSMPGVPFEMQHLLSDRVLPKLLTSFPISPIVHRTILTAGTGETTLAAQLSDFEDRLPENLKLAYLPSLGTVRLRLTATGNNEKELESQVEIFGDEMIQIVGAPVFGEGNLSLPKAIGNILTKKNQTMATAESCTGGYVAHLVTADAGCSAYFKGSIVAYDNAVKTNVLNVDKNLLATEGAVSEAVVRAMVAGVCARTGADVGIAISGIAGPTGATKQKAVGTIWLAAGTAENIITYQYSLDRGRDKNIEFASYNALNLLRKFLNSH